MGEIPAIRAEGVLTVSGGMASFSFVLNNEDKVTFSPLQKIYLSIETV